MEPKTQAQLIRMKAKLDRAAKREVQEAWSYCRSKKDTEYDIESFLDEVAGIGSCYRDDIDKLVAAGFDRDAEAARVVAARQTGVSHASR